MWSLITKDNISKFVDEYRNLIKYNDDIIIYANENHSFLPRLFYKNFTSKYITYTQDDNWSPTTINAEFIKDLRPHQKDIILDVDSFYNMTNTLSGIIKSNPGSGKTVMGVYLAVKYKFKTIIIVDQSNLVDQWVATIRNFTTIPDDRIGLIQGTTFKIDNCDIIIAMAQTLISRIHKTVLTNKLDANNDPIKILDTLFINDFYKRIRDAGINLVLYDECHVTGSAKKYTTSSFLFNTPNLIGLSATPFQEGLAKILMDNTVGDIISESTAYEENPSINFVTYQSKLPQKTISRIKQMNNFDFLVGRSTYNKEIITSKNYLRVINILVKNLIENNHVVIIIAFTKKQVELISSSLPFNNKTYYAKKKDVDKENDNIIVCTYSKTGKGFDMPRLSAAILACPLAGRKSLIQVIGRVLRSKDGKQTPVIYDLIDTSMGSMMTSNIHIKESILKNEFNNCDINHLNIDDLI